MFRSVTCLAGGVGAARFLEGLSRIFPQEKITVIVNTGDDLQYLGCHVSPDLDIVTYTLAGIVDREKGWGIQNDTYNSMEQLGKYGAETWFRIGDRDFATHLLRTEYLQQGFTLTEVTDKIRASLSVKVRILPMTDAPVATKIKTPEGLLEFQEYFVKRKFQDKVIDVSYEGAAMATPAPGVVQSIERSDLIVLCPSNPILSIGPILAINDIREALGKTRTKIVGVSPIIAGKSVKGPLDRMMSSLGLEVSPYGVAQLYRGLLRGFVIDEVDKSAVSRIQGLGIKPLLTKTLMDTEEAKVRLARDTLRLAEDLA
ncbi:MAG TPA: 2-phospho-L-lactate transferase [Candidatus Bathyarchaeia archaeon]|nr:2-phospho-L-lactate transferase [Candidatus Bathyarchaeia archaeon]